MPSYHAEACFCPQCLNDCHSRAPDGVAVLVDSYTVPVGPQGWCDIGDGQPTGAFATLWGIVDRKTGAFLASGFSCKASATAAAYGRV